MSSRWNSLLERGGTITLSYMDCWHVMTWHSLSRVSGCKVVNLFVSYNLEGAATAKTPQATHMFNRATRNIHVSNLTATGSLVAMTWRCCPHRTSSNRGDQRGERDCYVVTAKPQRLVHPSAAQLQSFSTSSIQDNCTVVTNACFLLGKLKQPDNLHVVIRHHLPSFLTSATHTTRVHAGVSVRVL